MGHTVQCDSKIKDLDLIQRGISKKYGWDAKHFRKISPEDEKAGKSFKVVNSAGVPVEKRDNENNVYLWQGQVGRTTDVIKVTKDPVVMKVDQVNVYDEDGVRAIYSDVAFARRPDGTISVQTDFHNCKGDGAKPFITEVELDQISQECGKDAAEQNMAQVQLESKTEWAAAPEEGDGAISMIVAVDTEKANSMQIIDLLG